MALIPTLKMFAATVTTDPAYLDPIYAQVREFHAQGGELLFGTDVGYMTDYSTAGEFEGLGKSGLNPTETLRMLTTAPAARFSVSAQTGRVKAGMAADLVILGDDPARGLGAFAQVRSTIRGGRILYGPAAQAPDG